MSGKIEQLKIVVGKVNEMFENDYNISSFDELHGDRLLAIVEAVLKTLNVYIDERNKFGIGQAANILKVLSLIRYTPPSATTADAFRKGITQGERATIHSVLFFLFSNEAQVQKRFYLSKYASKVEIPSSLLKKNPEMQRMVSQYSSTIESFWKAYTENVQEAKWAAETSELENDIELMRTDDGNLDRCIHAQSMKLQCGHDFVDKVRMLHNARRKHRQLQDQINADKRHLQEQIEFVRSCERRDKITQVDQLLERNEYYLSAEQIYKNSTRDFNKELHIIESIATESSPPTNEELTVLENEQMELQRNVKDLQVHRSIDSGMNTYEAHARVLAKNRAQLSKEIVKARLTNEQILNQIDEMSRILGGKLYKEYVAELKLMSVGYKQRKRTLDALEGEVSVLMRTKGLIHECDPFVAIKIRAVNNDQLPEELHDLTLVEVQREVAKMFADAIQQLNASKDVQKLRQDMHIMYKNLETQHDRLQVAFNMKTDFLPDLVRSLEDSVGQLEELLKIKQSDLEKEAHISEQLQDDLFRYSSMFIDQAGDLPPAQLLRNKLSVARKSLECLRIKVEVKQKITDNHQKELAEVKNIMLMIEIGKMG